ncbi:hypothetical protein Pmani_027273 [Petrolisthes manimaculis]|uniref:Uncharacterized protein n=1 Tax=Petrolisthes manimaculis TaxID=1843537 RepID=A0AAE1P3W2_9EUCA|nr:hypothetical protein Pmani_027273 [Petrolisthes manimaculis]
MDCCSRGSKELQFQVHLFRLVADLLGVVSERNAVGIHHDIAYHGRCKSSLEKVKYVFSWLWLHGHYPLRYEDYVFCVPCCYLSSFVVRIVPSLGVFGRSVKNRYLS